MRVVYLWIGISLWGCTEVTRTEPSGETLRPERLSEEGEEGTEPDVDGETDSDTAVTSPVDSGGVDSGFPEPTTSVDCLDIERADVDWEVCEFGQDECAGVYTDGAGCHAYCGAAGLVCTARYGGEPGCNKEPQNVIGCDDQNGHTSDWCVCGLPEETTGTTDTDCPSDPQNPPTTLEQGYRSATYTQRQNWVLDCRDYGYTAAGAEHEACDGNYQPDGARTGTATYVFEHVPRGYYDVYVGGRHTENRNPSGARFLVNGQSVVINQRTGGGYVWDHHGRYCLEGRVEVVLDSAVNSGSDSTWGAKLSPM